MGGMLYMQEPKMDGQLWNSNNLMSQYKYFFFNSPKQSILSKVGKSVLL